MINPSGPVIAKVAYSRTMTKLVQALPDFTEELLQGIASLGYKKLAASVYAIEVVERCKCDEPGCVTFFSVPKLSVPRPETCKRIVAPARGVTCIQYFERQIIWVEVLGRPEDRQKLDKYESQLAGINPANQALHVRTGNELKTSGRDSHLGNR